MNGEVDNAGRALMELRIRSASGGSVTDIEVWIDTAFTGELVVPRTLINSLGLKKSASVMAALADGTQVVLDTYSCFIDWFGNERQVEVIENDGQFPLLGIGLLLERRLEIDYRAKTLSMD